MIVSVVCTSDVAQRPLLRLGARYASFWKDLQGVIIHSSVSTRSMKSCATMMPPKVIRAKDAVGAYRLIELANVEPATGHLINLDNTIVTELGSDKVVLTGADLVFSKLNSHIGYVFLPEEIPSAGYELVGSTEFFPLKVDSQVIHPKLLKYLLLHPEFREKAVFLRTGKSQSHPRIQRQDFFDLLIPSVDSSKQSALLERINAIEMALREKRSRFESLQAIIEDVLCAHGLKTLGETPVGQEVFGLRLGDIAGFESMRMGARYHAFWVNHEGRLFEGTRKGLDVMPLKRLLRLDKRRTLKKGILSEPRTLIDFDQVDAGVGRVNSFDNLVVEIGSDKLEFGECDLLTNKLRPYLGYTLLNPRERRLIGTTEFIPLCVKDKDQVSPEFIRYLLLSADYLTKSQLLMSGKEHPRISARDILGIRVPVPERTEQSQIVTEIVERENAAEALRQEMDELRRTIDDIITEAVCESPCL